MGAPYRIARVGGVHANLTVVLTAMEGQSAGLQYTTKTFTTVGYDLGLKYTKVGGTQIGPVNTVLAGADPKWDAEANLVEVGEIQEWMGPGWAGIHLNITCTWQIPGNRAYTDRILGAHLGSCAVASKKDDVTSVKLGSDVTSIMIRGLDPFATVTFTQ